MSPVLTSRGVATRTRIVDAAADLMFEHGVGGTSLDDVLVATGTSKSQLYHYFADRDSLLRAVVERQAQRVLEGQGPVTDTLESLHAWGRAVVAGSAELDCVGGCPLGSLANELADRSERPGSRSPQASLPGRRTWPRASRRCAPRASSSRRQIPHELATAVLAAIQGGLLLAKTTRSTRPLELAVAMAEQHVGQYAA